MQIFFWSAGGGGQTRCITGDVYKANEAFKGVLSHHQVAQENG